VYGTIGLAPTVSPDPLEWRLTEYESSVNTAAEAAGANPNVTARAMADGISPFNVLSPSLALERCRYGRGKHQAVLAFRSPLSG
jgi:hypothetical protein